MMPSTTDTIIDDEDLPLMEICPSCDGSGLEIKMDGEPGMCHECKGNTVVPA